MGKKILVVEGADMEEMQDILNKIRSMNKNYPLIVNQDIKIYDIDECARLTNEEVRDYLESVGLKIK